MDDLQPVIERLRKAQEEEDRRERDCLAELRALGLLQAGFGERTRRWWSDEVRAVLLRHGYKIGSCGAASRAAAVESGLGRQRRTASRRSGLG